MTLCDDCTALCCRAGGTLELSSPERAKEAGYMQLRTLLPPKDDYQFVSYTVPSVGSFAARIRPGRGFYMLLHDCGRLDPATSLCRNYEDRPEACRDFEAGSEVCLNLRRLAGLD